MLNLENFYYSLCALGRFIEINANVLSSELSSVNKAVGVCSVR